ncbi:MAG: TonB family protein, partial [Bacteroidota bacterium]
HRFRLLQELSCDQAVLQGSDKQTRLHYAKALLNASSPKPTFTLNQLTFGEKNMLKERLTQLKVNKPSHFMGRLVAALSILLLGTVLTLANAKISPASDHIKPTMRVNPKYPAEAAEKGIEGTVRMSFDVDPQGSVSNINIIGSIPEGVFDHNAKLALSQWQYANPTGKTISAEVQLDFVLSAELVEKIEVMPLSAILDMTDTSNTLGAQFVSPYPDFLIQTQRVGGAC